ncbi:hypothetical protein FQA39_LY17757 [Lamprigera yunnana]|nr:hypothetical protein FQA39_LY17757 [Lamprigera yunnana]
MRTTQICLNRTINLAKNIKKCPDKTTLLIYNKNERPIDRGADCIPTSNVDRVPTKKIRICTGAELKKMCRPPPCSCPPELSKFGSVSYYFFRFVLFCIKSATISGLIYWTWDVGVWGDSEDTERFYSNICYLFTDCKKPEKTLSKACQKEQEIRQLELISQTEDECKRPTVNRAKTIYKIKNTWNRAITTIFGSFATLPESVKHRFENSNKDSECLPIKTK